MTRPALGLVLALLGVASLPAADTPKDQRNAAWLQNATRRRWPERELEAWIKQDSDRTRVFMQAQKALRRKDPRAAAIQFAELLKGFFPKGSRSGGLMGNLEGGAAQEGHEALIGMLFRKIGMLYLQARDYADARRASWNARVFLGGGNQFAPEKGLLSDDPRLIPVLGEELQACLGACASLGRTATRELSKVTLETRPPPGDSTRVTCYQALHAADDQLKLLGRVLGASSMNRSVSDSFARSAWELKTQLLRMGFVAGGYWGEGLRNTQRFRIADPVLMVMVLLQEAQRLEMEKGPEAGLGFLDRQARVMSDRPYVAATLHGQRALRLAALGRRKEAKVVAAKVPRLSVSLMKGVASAYQTLAGQELGTMLQHLAPLR